MSTTTVRLDDEDEALLDLLAPEILEHVIGNSAVWWLWATLYESANR